MASGGLVIAVAVEAARVEERKFISAEVDGVMAAGVASDEASGGEAVPGGEPARPPGTGAVAAAAAATLAAVLDVLTKLLSHRFPCS